MSKIMTCVLIEGKKLFSSKVPLISMLVLTLVPFTGGFFMFALKNPDLAQNLGLISTKAHIVGTADWASYFKLLAQAIAIGGLIVFGFITSWVFGREYSDRTINDLLALPISRNVIVFSKFIVTVLLCLILSIYVLAIGLLIGRIVHIPGWSFNTMIVGITVFTFCSILTILLSPLVALFASVGRGYLSPLGFMIFTLVLAQIVAVTGYGHLFPWSIPAITSGIVGDGQVMLEGVSIFIILLTNIFGIVGTMLWWRYADQS